MVTQQTEMTGKPDYAPPPVEGDFYRIAAVLNESGRALLKRVREFTEEVVAPVILDDRCNHLFGELANTLEQRPPTLVQHGGDPVEVAFDGRRRIVRFSGHFCLLGHHRLLPALARPACVTISLLRLGVAPSSKRRHDTSDPAGH